VEIYRALSQSAIEARFKRVNAKPKKIKKFKRGLVKDHG
jgi:hypothetical protein